jgi:superfamily II DNA/RNA helicase
LSFTDFNLQKDFITSIEAAGYQSPTPLQSQLIPLVEKQQSALVLSQSAAGKTGAFLIPAINYILKNPAPEKRGARILILTSRRDRVSQINYTIKRLSREHNMRFGFIVSGRPYQTQMRLMRRPLDIMIATPGRLNDLMENKKADFSQLEMLIIDDLSSIYQKNLHGLVEKILQQAKQDIPSLVFVNDDNGNIVSFAHEIFPNATTIHIEEDENEEDSLGAATNNVHNNKKTGKAKTSPPKGTVATIDPTSLMPQIVHIADDYTHKIALMDHLLDEFEGEATIIYTSTPKVAKTLQENLTNHGHTTKLLHDLSAQELAAEDINTLIICDQDNTEKTQALPDKPSTHLIHFDLPYKTANFIKRLGNHSHERDDAAILIVDGRNFSELKQIEKNIGSSLKQTTVPGLEPLLPFVNKSKPGNKSYNHNKGKPGAQQKNNRNQPRKSSTKSKNNKTGNDENKSRRQRKGPFGRLNGGVHRKQSDSSKQNTGSKSRNKNPNNNNSHNNPKRRNNKQQNHRQIGLSTRGTTAPTSDRAWQSDFAEPKERKAPTKRVVIRYKDKKRSLLPENANNDS